MRRPIRRDQNHGSWVDGHYQEPWQPTMVIYGAPRTKKTSNRIVRAGKRPRVLPSEAFERWASAAVPQMRVCWSGRAAISKPVNVAALFYRDAYRGDAVGYYQALADALQAAGVVVDDKWIVSWDGSRMEKDAERPRIELEISEVES